MQQFSTNLQDQDSPVLAAYRQQLKVVQGRLAAAQARRWRALFGAVSFGVACIFAAVSAASGFTHALLLCAAAALGSAVCIRFYRREGRTWRNLQVSEESIQAGIARLTDDWRRNSSSGMEFVRPGHLYQTDLQVLGEGSLFSLLNTTRTNLGAARLAALLLDPAT